MSKKDTTILEAEKQLSETPKSVILEYRAAVKSRRSTLGEIHTAVIHTGALVIWFHGQIVQIR